MICNNGGEVVSFPQGKVIFRRLLPKPEILSLVEYCLSQGADFCITTPEGAYFPNGSAMRQPSSSNRRVAHSIQSPKVEIHVGQLKS